MNKICVVVIYFGKLPTYFDLWLKSCESNNTIDFLFFTDNEFYSLPKNVKLIPFTLAKIKALVENKLDMTISLDRPYKICDFRPAYGVIFADYLTSYDYWAHCDVDLIFGDIQFFLDKYNLYEYDKFLTLGHLAFYKNNDRVNNAFKLEGSLVGDYNTIFKNDENHFFDELKGINEILRNNRFKIFEDRPYADIAKYYKRLRISRHAGYKAINYKHQIFYWENGKLLRDYYKNGKILSEEFCYIHLIKRNFEKQSFDIESCNSYYITSEGFVIKDNTTTLKDIKRYNQYKGRLYEYKEYMDYYNLRVSYFDIFFNKLKKFLRLNK